MFGVRKETIWDILKPIFLERIARGLAFENDRLTIHFRMYLHFQKTKFLLLKKNRAIKNSFKKRKDVRVKITNTTLEDLVIKNLNRYD